MQGLWTIFQNFTIKMYQPRNASSLAVIRIMFGVLMTIDTLMERGGLDLAQRWGQGYYCHFPLVHFLNPPSLSDMKGIYFIMWIGALGIALGYKFRLSAILFCGPYWYLLMLDKSYWNNHSYLFGVIGLLFLGSSASNFWSLDALWNCSERKTSVPFWNYFILKSQIFLLYFLAGLKKMNQEWLSGYAMTNLGTHWVFDPFKVILNTDQIDHLVVHWFGFLLDLTIGFWLLHRSTRPFALVVCAMFHFMNSRLFSIGMFPYVGLATLPLFCDDDWPLILKETVLKFYKEIRSPSKNSESKSAPLQAVTDKENMNKGITTKASGSCGPISWKNRLVSSLVILHIVVQCLLPYSHVITKGYNNWTSGLYGYSWDMMVHSWNTAAVIVRVVDNESGRERFLDPYEWTPNDRWSKHGDMCVQYAKCAEKNLNHILNKEASNLSIYVDVWCSLNKRFQQRMFDPNYDLLRAEWSPFKPVQWLLPLLTQYTGFRAEMSLLQKQVYSWSNHSDVLFVADFPGMSFENFLSPDLSNVTLTVLSGEVYVEDEEKRERCTGIRLQKGFSFKLEQGTMHRVNTVGELPSLFMYTFVNQTRDDHAMTL